MLFRESIPERLVRAGLDRGVASPSCPHEVTRSTWQDMLLHRLILQIFGKKSLRTENETRPC